MPNLCQGASPDWLELINHIATTETDEPQGLRDTRKLLITFCLLGDNLHIFANIKNTILIFQIFFLNIFIQLTKKLECQL